MSHFFSDQRLTIASFVRPDGKTVWVTSRDFGFVLGGIDGQTTPAMFIVPEGFETDLGSIPWWARAIFSPSDPQAARAYVLHDWVNYLTAGRPPGKNVWSSRVAAAILYDALRLDGASPLKAGVVTTAVTLGIAKGEK